MPISNDSLNKKLYQLLKTQGFDPVPKNSKGDTTPVPDDADVFRFTFKVDGKPVGPAWITIDSNQELKVYYDDEVMNGLSEDGGDGHIDDFTEFLKQLKQWAQRRQLGFDLENQDHLESDMAQREYVKKQEQVNEGYYPMGKTSSYSDSVPNVKIILQHTRAIQEGEQRFRNIARIFLENTVGERILAPTTRPGIARVYARHLAEGGLPHDDRWSHIGSLVEEYTKMAGFVRATRGNQFNESAQRLVNEGINHYQSLRETLSRMTGHKGYNNYFESYTPALMEDETDNDTLNELFVQETMDPRIESVMPILSRLHKKVNEMSEVKSLEEWADSIISEKMVMGSGSDASSAGSYKMGEATDPTSIPEDDIDEGLGDVAKKVGGALKRGAQKAIDVISPSDEQLLKDLQKRMGLPPHAQHGKPRMAVPNDEVNEEEVEESGLQAYLGNKKYGKEGMDALRKAGREHAGKEKMANIRAKYDKLDEVDMDEGMFGSKDVQKMLPKHIAADIGRRQLASKTKELIAKDRQQTAVPGTKATSTTTPQAPAKKVAPVTKSTTFANKERGVEEGLDANQKRVGQLGPTEKITKSNPLRGKLVGANESFINTTSQAVTTEEEVAEGSSMNASQALRDFYTIARMRDQFTYAGLEEAGHADKVLNAIKACSAIYNYFKNNKDLNSAKAIDNLRSELISFKNGDISTLSQLIKRGTLDKINLQEQGVAEGSNDTVYPNAEVIKSKNGKPVGEIYQDESGWGCFHYKADRGYDTIDSREDAIQALKDLHNETARHRPDYTIKGVAEGTYSKDVERAFPGGKASGVKTGASAPKGTSTMPKDKEKAKGKPAGAITEMDKSQKSSGRGGESSGDPYAKGGKATPIKFKDAAKDAKKLLDKHMDKEHKKEVKEGQEDLDAILRIIKK